VNEEDPEEEDSEEFICILMILYSRGTQGAAVKLTYHSA
jgi:hypothetical protein